MTINLHDMHIMVTRPPPAGLLLCKLIEEKGGRAMHFPTIAFVKPQDEHAFYQALTLLHQQEWIIFVSPQAVYHCLFAMRALQLHFPSHLKFAAIGASTAKALQEAGYPIVLYPDEDWTTEGLLQLPAFQSVASKNVAIVRGDGGREFLDNMLVIRGAHVLPIIAYQRVLPQINANEYLNVLRKDMIHVIVCMSFESIRNLQLLLGEGFLLLKNTPLLVASNRIKELARGLGFQTIWVAKNASSDAILEILSEKRKEI